MYREPSLILVQLLLDTPSLILRKATTSRYFLIFATLQSKTRSDILPAIIILFQIVSSSIRGTRNSLSSTWLGISRTIFNL